MNPSAPLEHAFSVATENKSLFIEFDLRHDSARLAYRILDRERISLPIGEDEAAELYRWLLQNVTAEEQNGPNAFSGYIVVNGTPAAVASLPHTQGVHFVFHLGLKSIRDFDRFMRRRILVMRNLPDSLDYATREALQNALNRFFDTVNDLEDFDLYAFASSHGFAIGDRPALQIETNAEAITETIARLRAMNEGPLSMEWYDVHRQVVGEFARKMRAQIDSNDPLAAALDAKIAEIESEDASVAEHVEKRRRIENWEGQRPLDEAEFKKRVERLAALTFEFNGNENELASAFTRAVDMIPRAKIKRGFRTTLFGQQPSWDMTFPRIVIGELLNYAESAWMDTRDTDEEKASDVCAELVRNTYSAIKRGIFGPTPRSDHSMN